MTTRNLLVLGGSGQLGTAMRHKGPAAGYAVVAPERSELDLGDAEQLARLLNSRSWDAVVNCAAYTAVDAAESDEADAMEGNAHAVERLARVVQAAGVPLVHVSTDYVFDGTKGSPYVETDPTAPLGVYGRSKLAGEDAVRAIAPSHFIVRTAWVVSPWRSNFLKTMVRLIGERDEVKVVADQRGAPTSAEDLADALVAMLKAGGGDDGARYGTYHFANAGETTWHGFAASIGDYLKATTGNAASVTPITTAQYPTPAKRPADSRLSTAKIEAAFNIRPRPWQDAVKDILEAL